MAEIPSNVPVPDPSVITTQEFIRTKAELRDEFKTAIGSLHELMDGASRARHEIVITRLNAMDKAAEVLAADVSHVPTLLDRETRRLEKLFEEKINGIITKFDGIQVQFRERDIRTDQDKIAASTAVNAALQAQKEAAGAQNEANAAAITKSENSFTKEIDGLKTLINATKDAITSDVSNLTGRLDRGESGSQGRRDEVQDHRANSTLTVGQLGLAGAVVLIVLAGLTLVLNSRASPIPGPSGSQTTAIPRSQ